MSWDPAQAGKKKNTHASARSDFARVFILTNITAREWDSATRGELCADRFAVFGFRCAAKAGATSIPYVFSEMISKGSVWVSSHAFRAFVWTTSFRYWRSTAEKKKPWLASRLAGGSKDLPEVQNPKGRPFRVSEGDCGLVISIVFSILGDALLHRDSCRLP
jgi:hypothetical protein